VRRARTRMIAVSSRERVAVNSIDDRDWSISVP
jgi:hypothetical protein